MKKTTKTDSTKNAKVITPRIKFAREVYKAECLRIDGLTAETALKEATGLTKNVKMLIESGLLLLDEAEKIPCLSILALKGKQYLFAIREVSTIKVDNSVSILKTSDTVSTVQEYMYTPYNTVTIGHFPMVDKSYNFKTCKIVDDSIEYFGETFKISSFQKADTKASSGKIGVCKDNLTAEQFSDIIENCKAQLKANAKKNLEKVENKK